MEQETDAGDDVQARQDLWQPLVVAGRSLEAAHPGSGALYGTVAT